jgi:hypothetical protein
LDTNSLLRGGKLSTPNVDFVAPKVDFVSIKLTKEDEEHTYKAMRALAPKIRNVEPRLPNEVDGFRRSNDAGRRLTVQEKAPTAKTTLTEPKVSVVAPVRTIRTPRTLMTFSLVDVQHDPFESVSKEITYRSFVDQYLSSGEAGVDPLFLAKYVKSLETMTLRKVEFYEEYVVELKSSIQAIMKDIEDLKEMGITPDRDEWFPSLRQTWLTYSKVKSLVAKLKTSRPSPKEVQEGFLRAFFDPHRGLDRIVGREDFKDFLVRGIFALSNNPKSFDGFNNMIFYGGPGIGKTVMAQTVSWFYQNLYILDSPQSRVCTSADLVGQYLGQTAPLTRAILMDTLGGVLFVDEAYGIGTHTYGSEALSEIVNFLDKLMGKSIVILAGYEEEMKKVVSHNPGLLRRFPHSFLLTPFSPEELTSIFLERVSELLPSGVEVSTEVANTLFTLISRGVERGKFVNQAGDMLNLANGMVSKLFSSTSSSSSPSTKEIINVAIELFE